MKKKKKPEPQVRAVRKQWVAFVREMVRSGNATAAYQLAYPKVSERTAQVNGARLLERPIIQEMIRDYAATVEVMPTKEGVNRLRAEVLDDKLTAERKKEILRDIAEGTAVHKELKPYYDEATDTWKSKVVRISQPTLADRMRAIEIHNRMVGDNAPEKLDHTTKGEKIGPLGSYLDFENMPVETLQTLEKYLVDKNPGE